MVLPTLLLPATMPTAGSLTLSSPHLRQGLGLALISSSCSRTPILRFNLLGISLRQGGTKLHYRLTYGICLNACVFRSEYLEDVFLRCHRFFSSPDQRRSTHVLLSFCKFFTVMYIRQFFRLVLGQTFFSVSRRFPSFTTYDLQFDVAI